MSHLADTVATLAIKTILDNSALIAGFRTSQDEVTNFTRTAKTSGDEIRTAFAGAAEGAGRIFENLASGNYRGAFAEAKKLLDEHLAVKVGVDAAGVAPAARQARDAARAIFREPITQAIIREPIAQRSAGETIARDVIRERTVIREPIARSIGEARDIAVPLRVDASTVLPAVTRARAEAQAALSGVLVQRGVFDGADLIRGAASSANAAAAHVGTAAASSATSISGLLSGLASAAGPATLWGAAAVGAIVGIGAAARSVTSDLVALDKFARRIGTDTTSAQTIVAVFERGGLSQEAAEATINRFRDRLGDLRTNFDGQLAQSLRRLRLDPEAIGAEGLEQNFRTIFDALKGLESGYDQAALSQQIFGKSFQEIQASIQLGSGAFDFARERVNLFGDSEEEIERAKNAQKQWREFGVFWSDLWGSLSDMVGDAFGRISDKLSATAALGTRAVTGVVDFAARLIAGVSSVDLENNVPSLGGNRSVLPARSTADVRAEDAVRAMRERNELNTSLVGQASALGLISSGNARDARREAEAVREVLQQRRRIVEEMTRQGDSQEAINARLREFDQAALVGVQQRREAETSATRDVIRDIQRRGTAENVLRERAEQLGLVREGASASELASVRDLVDAYERLAERPNVDPNVLDGERLNLQEEAERRRQAGALQTAQEAERGLQFRRLVEQEGLSVSRAKERLDIESGIIAAYAKRARLAAEENDARNRLQTLRTPRDEFDTQRRRLAELRESNFLTAQQEGRLLANQFLELERSLGGGPRSFSIDALDPRSLEGARFIADLQVRNDNGVNDRDPNARVVRVLEAAGRRDDQRNRRLDEIHRALQAAPPLRAAGL